MASCCQDVFYCEYLAKKYNKNVLRKKQKKTFFKIKEKLVFITPKKFLGRKFFGVLCLICGSLILALTGAFFYIIPHFFPPKTKIVEILPEKPTFVPQRILFPKLGIDLPVYKNKPGESTALILSKIKTNEEVLVLGNKDYQIYKVVSVNISISSNSAEMTMLNNKLKLILLLPGKPAKNMIIEGESIN